MALNKHGSEQAWLLLNCIDKVIRLADVAARPKQLKPVSKDTAEAAVRSAAVSQPPGPGWVAGGVRFLSIA
jgi:hypothetical protein